MKPNVKHILFSAALIAGCSPTAKKVYQHDYKKYYEEYELSNLIDSLYSDTLKIGPDSEGNRTATPFYISKIKALIHDLKDDWNQIDSLYPNIEFDEITIQNITIGNHLALNKSQMDKLLSIVNNPNNFDWGESTDSPGLVVGFNRKGVRKGAFLISDDLTEIYPYPEWPTFKKMKFGHLKKDAQHKLDSLLNEIGYE